MPAVLKSLLRESQRTRIAAYKAAARSSYGHGGGRPNGQRPRLGEPPKTPPDCHWDKLTEELVLDYCRRCHMTALARAAYPAAEGAGATAGLPSSAGNTVGQGGHHAEHTSGAQGTAGQASSGTRPPVAVPLKPGSVVREAYHVDWPGIHAEHLRPDANDADFLSALHVNATHRPQAADDAWQLDYVRIEERTSASGSESYYRRQLTNCVVHSLPNGVWLDGFSERSEKGGVQTVDVVITRAGAAGGPPADEEQELTIQILSMDLGSLRE